jgi:hypothetical protein
VRWATTLLGVLLGVLLGMLLLLLWARPTRASIRWRGTPWAVMMVLLLLLLLLAAVPATR